MKKYTDLTIGKAALVAFSLIFFLFTSCKDSDENKENTPTTVQQTPGDSTTATVTTTDTGTVVSTNSTAPIPNQTGIGKPNPSKKGGKGKATFRMTSSTASNAKMEMDKEGVYNRADVMPSFPGGEKALIKYLENNIQYPQAAIDDGVEGTVQLNFAVDENGKVYAPTLRSEKIGYGLEEEAMRVISTMPKWNPGNIKGKNVKTRFDLPVTYQIN